MGLCGGGLRKMGGIIGQATYVVTSEDRGGGGMVGQNGPLRGNKMSGRGGLMQNLESGGKLDTLDEKKS